MPVGVFRARRLLLGQKLVFGNQEQIDAVKIMSDWEERKDRICQECNGDGTYECPECDGSGVLTCEECDGSGEIDQEED